MSPPIYLRGMGPEYLIIGFKASDSVFMVRRSRSIDCVNGDFVDPIWCDRIAALLCSA
jgi:hypothetical protein